MKPYLNYGGGVNSTAMSILVLTDDRWAEYREDLRFVFCDTKAELPETLCYVQYFSKWLSDNHGHTVEVLASSGLLEYCKQLKMIPSRRFRWCTRKFKGELIDVWAAENGLDTCLIGYDAGEFQRAAKADGYVDHNRYPLIQAGLDRQDCIDLIRVTGLEVPRRSGCFCCPHANKARFEDLRTYHPELFEYACEMERNIVTKAGRRMYLKDKPLAEWIVSPGLDFDEPCEVCEVS
jgi:3'-phosphoadenosine 5'-phosphosulfate sulfotransferase (PAPS reductase)/FAD synthetase